MRLSEYEKIRNFTYLEYCDYLQQKYGIGLSDYMTKNYNMNKKVTRTREGFFAHHRFEDHMIMLCKKDVAMQCPFEWQLAKNIVYCDYLEHLFLHILICENPSPERIQPFKVGIGGVLNFIVPELNDFYSGWQTKQEWRRNCFEKVCNDIDCYFALLKRFKANCHEYYDGCFFQSFNEPYGLWSKEKNQQLFDKIKLVLD
ncbi:MAG: hypothetical protein IJB17_01375 [Oscillospiraceae bacterium]|nr:hypothetical protein [Oscillospiraceae bacterium]